MNTFNPFKNQTNPNPAHGHLSPVYRQGSTGRSPVVKAFTANIALSEETSRRKVSDNSFLADQMDNQRYSNGRLDQLNFQLVKLTDKQLEKLSNMLRNGASATAIDAVREGYYVKNLIAEENRRANGGEPNFVRPPNTDHMAINYIDWDSIKHSDQCCCVYNSECRLRRNYKKYEGSFNPYGNGQTDSVPACQREQLIDHLNYLADSYPNYVDDDDILDVLIDASNRAVITEDDLHAMFEYYTKHAPRRSTPRGPLPFLEGGFNPYGNGQTSLIMLAFLCALAASQPLTSVGLYENSSCGAGHLFLNMSTEGGCYLITHNVIWSYNYARWYGIPFTPTAEVFFFNLPGCSDTIATYEVDGTNCVDGPGATSNRMVGSSGSLTAAPTSATPAPTAAIPPLNIWNYSGACSGLDIAIPYNVCTSLNPLINAFGLFHCVTGVAVLNLYNNATCSPGSIEGGGTVTPSLLCQEFINVGTGQVTAHYRLDNEFSCPGVPPTIAPTSTPAPTTAAPTGAPTTGPPTSAPTSSPTRAPTAAPTPGCPAAISANVVGWAQQDAPIWVTLVDPRSQPLPITGCGYTVPPPQKYSSEGMAAVLDYLAFSISAYARGDYNISGKIRNKLMHALNGNSNRIKRGRPSQHQVDEVPALEDPAIILAELERQKAEFERTAAALEVKLPERADLQPPVVEPVVPLPKHKTFHKPRPSIEQRKPLLPKNWLETMIDNRIQTAHHLWIEGRLVTILCPELETTPAKQTSSSSSSSSEDLPPAPPTKPKPVQREQGSRTNKAQVTARNAQRDKEALFDLAAWTKGVDRVVTTLKKKPETVAEWWMSHPESKDFRMAVIDALWGKGWRDQLQMTSNQWFVYCKISGISREACLFRILSLFPEWRQAIERDDVSATWLQATGTQWSDAYDLLSAELATRNSLIVVPSQINGNNGSATNTDDHMKTPLCRTQTDVEGQASASALYDLSSFSSALPYLKGSELACRLATEPSSTNATQLSLPGSLVLRGDSINPANNIIQDRGIPLPSTCLIPRQVRNGPGAPLVFSAFRLSTKTVGPITALIHPVSDSDLMKVMVDAAIKANQNIGRADNVNLAGFHAIDLAWLGRLRAVKGLNMDQCLLKLLLLHKCLSWNFDPRSLPMAQAMAFDQHTNIDQAGGVEISFNDSPLFGESCGGPTAVFPMLGGETGNVYFHLTTETVPTPERSMALWIPATILQQDTSRNIGMALFLFIVMWAPAPFGLWTVSVDTVDSAGGNPAEQLFVHSASLVNVPGITNLHIILPRTTTSRNPTAQLEANNLCVLRPRAGPLASTGIPADQLLNVNFVGGNLIGYNLAEYMYTWSGAVDQTQVANFIQRLSYTTGIRAALERAQDLSIACSEMFPSLPVPIGFNLAPSFDPNTIQQASSVNAWGISYEPVGVNFPVNTELRSDYLVYETDPLAWNKIATGLATSTAPPELSYVLPDWIGNTRAAAWEQLMGMAFAVTWCSHYANLGWNAVTWDTAYNNNSQPEFREQVRKYYQLGWDLVPVAAEFGPMMANYFSTLTGRRPGCAVVPGGTLTIFDMMCPPTGQRCNIWGLLNQLPNIWQLYVNMAPVFLADIWIQYFSRQLPKWQSSIPLPNGPDSWKGYHSGMVPMIVTDQLKGGLIDQGYDRQTLLGNETADFSDEMRWNERMMYLSARSTPTRRNGGALQNVCSAGQLYQQRPTQQAWFQPQLPPYALFSGTFGYPICEEDGQLVFAVTFANDGVASRAAMYHRQQLSWWAWQIAGMIAWADEVMQADAKSKSKWSKHAVTPGKVSTSSMEPGAGGEETSTL